MKNGKYKILSISGGGAYGCIPAKFLEYVDGDHPLDEVDVITGASIGGILALSYASGRGFKFVSDMFQKRVKDCFKKRWQAKIWPLACPTYDNAALDEVIKDIVGDVKVGDIKSIYPNLSVFVGSTNVTDDNFKVYDNVTGRDDDVLLRDICGQTSAAPTYFYGRDVNGKCMVDQGLIDNFGMMTAATAVRGKLGVEFKDMDILILGTGQDKDDDVATPKRYNNYGMLDICTKLIVPYVTYSNQLVSLYWGRNMGFNSFELFNPLTTTGHMDNVKEVPGLVEQCETHKDDFIKVWNEWLNR